MQITFRTSPVTEALYQYAKRRFEKSTCISMTELVQCIDISLSQGTRQTWRATAIATLSCNSEVTASSTGNDPYACIDLLADRVRRQMIKLKEKGQRSRRQEAELVLDASAQAAQFADERDQSAHARVRTGPGVIYIAWTPETVNEFQYAEVVQAIGDLVREQGGIGVERVRTGGCGVPAPKMVPA